MTPDADPALRPAVGMTRPVSLRVEHDTAGVLADGQIDQPFAVIGSDAGCEIALNDPTLPARAAALQVIDGRVVVFPFDTLAGVALAAGGWRVGRFTLTVTDPGADGPPEAGESGPRVSLRLPTGGEWVMADRVAFVGTAGGCAVRPAAPDVAPVHAYLLKADGRVWVIDLRAEAGTWVNDRPVRAAELHDGDDLRVGGARLGVRCDGWGEITSHAPVDQPDPSESCSDPLTRVGRSALRPDLSPAGRGRGEGPSAVPIADRSSDHPSPLPRPAGERSPAAVPPAGEGVFNPPAAESQLFGQRHDPDPDLVTLTPAPVAAADDPAAAAVLQQMMAEFRQSIEGVMAAFGEMRRQHAEAMQVELSRMAELNAELQRLRGPAAAEPARPLYHPLPEPEGEIPVGEPADRYRWVAARLAEIEAERQGIWVRLRGLFGRTR